MTAGCGVQHGTFVPLYVMYPAADVPVLQLSLHSSFDPQKHLAIGRALSPLRDEGVLIVGSGVPSFHNLSQMRRQQQAAARDSHVFDAWLTQACVERKGAERSKLLEEWEQAPSARAAHAREEHLLPLFVAAGAAEEEPGFLQYHSDDAFGFLRDSGFRFGAAAAP
jgi:aromatic ring-opening dioxygenase catalytic subunit (LigB family)